MIAPSVMRNDSISCTTVLEVLVPAESPVDTEYVPSCRACENALSIIPAVIRSSLFGSLGGGDNDSSVAGPKRNVHNLFRRAGVDYRPYPPPSNPVRRRPSCKDEAVAEVSMLSCIAGGSDDFIQMWTLRASDPR